MTIISFMNLKGGTGKTASVATIGQILSGVHGKKVLLVDNDPQGNLTSVFTDEKNIVEEIDAALSGEREKSEKLIDGLYLKEGEDVHEYIRHTRYDNLDIIGSNLVLATTETLLRNNAGMIQQYRLREYLPDLSDEYDYILIDCGPSMDILSINALCVSDRIYIPSRTDHGSLLGNAMTVNTINEIKRNLNRNLEIGGVFFTAFNSRENAGKDAKLIMEAKMPGILMHTDIGTTTLAKKIGTEKKMLLEMDRNNKVTKAYLALTEEIISG